MNGYFWMLVVLTYKVTRSSEEEATYDDTEAGDYVYDDTPMEEIENKGGARLINAKAANANHLQFVGALYLGEKDPSAKCTSILISPRYALT